MIVNDDDIINYMIMILK